MYNYNPKFINKNRRNIRIVHSIISFDAFSHSLFFNCYCARAHWMLLLHVWPYLWFWIITCTFLSIYFLEFHVPSNLNWIKNRSSQYEATAARKKNLKYMCHTFVSFSFPAYIYFFPKFPFLFHSLLGRSRFLFCFHFFYFKQRRKVLAETDSMYLLWF